MTKKLPVLGLVIMLVLGIGVWGFSTEWGKLAILKKEKAVTNPLTSVDYLECQEYLSGHLHTRNDALDQGGKGWVTGSNEGRVLRVTKTGNTLVVTGGSAYARMGQFKLLTDISEQRLVAVRLDDQREDISQAQMLLLDKGTGQMTVYLTENFAGGVMGEQIIYTCNQKQNPNVSDFDKAVTVVGSISEVNKIKDRVLANSAKPYFSDEGKDARGGCYLVSLHESFEDGHTNRIETFCVDLQTKVVTVDDVVNAKRITLLEWQKQVRQNWGF